MHPLLNFLFSMIVGTSAFAESPDQAAQIALAEKVYEDLHWRKLMHFEKTYFGFFESQIDGPGFFISPNGKYSLREELTATMQAFFSATEGLAEEKIAQCRFPARYSYLKKRLAQKISKWPDRVCPHYQRWYDTLLGESLSLVFSSYYLNNPSSSFGHTFIRVNKAPSAKDGKRYELLDYGISFGANATTSNPLVYAFKGMFGMFPSTFNSMPYYYKVREYNDAESRDLWEYELRMSKDAVKMFLAHIWELGPNPIDYWYLTENCSYHMVSVLEAADPSINLLAKLKKYVIPADVVQAAWNAGLVREFHYRPSIRTEFYTRLAELSGDEREDLKNIIKQVPLVGEFPRNKKVLDTAIDYMDYHYAIQVQSPTPESKFKNQLLSARSRIPEVTEGLHIPPPQLEQPHLSHPSWRLGLGYQSNRVTSDAFVARHSFALHDQLDPMIGYPEYAHIMFWEMALSYSPSKARVDLEDFTLFELVSTPPFGEFSPDLSWRMKLGVERIRNENCDFCHAGVFNFGSGITFKPFSQAFTAFFGLRAGLMYVDASPFWFGGAGPQARWRLRVGEKLNLLAEAWWRWDANVAVGFFRELSAAAQWNFSREYGLRLQVKDVGFDVSSTLEGMYYF